MTFSVIIASLVFGFRARLGYIFVSDEDVVKQVQQVAWLAALYQFPDCFFGVISGILRWVDAYVCQSVRHVIGLVGCRHGGGLGLDGWICGGREMGGSMYVYACVGVRANRCARARASVRACVCTHATPPQTCDCITHPKWHPFNTWPHPHGTHHPERRSQAALASALSTKSGVSKGAELASMCPGA